MPTPKQAAKAKDSSKNGSRNGRSSKAISRSDLVNACVTVIGGKSSTLYGGYFTIKGGQAELTKAAEWLAGECAAVLSNLGIELQAEEP